jgi:ABC-type nitrate/sulfonate/bicarbonate transport system permease component
MISNDRRNRQTWDSWISALVFVLFLGAWEGFSRLGWISQLFFPAPSKIISSLFSMIVSGKLMINLVSTLERLGLGFLMGAVPGLVLGLFMGWSSRLRRIVDPFIAAFHPLPKIAIFPIIMVIFGIGELSKIVAIALSTFFPILINSMAGVRQLSPVYFEVTRNYGANLWKTLRRVVIPGSLPSILSGIRIAMNLAMVITITVELVSATQGLGVIIWFAWQTMRIEELYASLVVTAVLGILLNLVLYQLSRKLVPWSATITEGLDQP